MKLLPFLLGGVLLASAAADEPKAKIQRDLPYGAEPLQTLDVYANPDAKNAPVTVWIHGGGWQAGDKSNMAEKPRAFMEKGFVFVSINYRLLPTVAMADIVRDTAKAVHWVHDHVAEYGGDPERLFIMGHSAGAQLAALLCTDDRYLKAEGLTFSMLKGCVPLDGDTYDVPLVISTATAIRHTAGKPEPTYGHREKFGGTPAQWRDFSAVNYVAAGKGIPGFLLLHVATDPSTTMQAQRLGGDLVLAGIPTTLFGAADTNHNKLDANLGVAGDPATQALYEFLDQRLKP